VAWDFLSAEEKAWQKRCRAFAEEHMAPWTDFYDQENAFAERVHLAAFEAELLNASFPQTMGGQGRSFKALVVGGEAMASVCAPITFSLGFNHGALHPVMLAGRDEQRSVYVKDILDQQGYAALCLSEEEHSGSDLMGIRTTAQKTSNGWVLNGKKCMVGHGTVAKLFLVLCQTTEEGKPRGLSFFAVPKQEGVQVGTNTNKLGFRAVPTPEVTFENIVLEEKNLIGKEGEGASILFRTLNFIRLGGAPVILGLAAGALEDVLPWIEKRKIFGNDPLMAASHIQMQLGEFYARLESARAMTWRAAIKADAGEDFGEESSMAKLLASELAIDITSAVVQIFGWRGIDARYPIQKRYRDARQTTIYEGTSELQRMNIFRAMRTEFKEKGHI